MPTPTTARRNRSPSEIGWLASFFFSYVIEKTRPTDPAVVERFKAAIKAAADKEIGYLNANAYPVGTPMNLRWWGSNAAQGQYAYPCLLQWALTKEQKYIDAASQLMDYTQGLNPIGKCYVCGIGFNRVHNPHDRESAYTKEKGWGPRPGILVFGPGGSRPGRVGSCGEHPGPRTPIHRQSAFHPMERVHRLSEPVFSRRGLSGAGAGRQVGRDERPVCHTRSIDCSSCRLECVTIAPWGLLSGPALGGKRDVGGMEMGSCLSCAFSCLGDACACRGCVRDGVLSEFRSMIRGLCEACWTAAAV